MSGKSRKTRRRSGRPVRRMLRARDLMTRTPVTVPADMRVGALCDLLQEKNINGVPVLDARGRMVGVVTQEDIIYGAMGNPVANEVDEPPRAGQGARRRPEADGAGAAAAPAAGRRPTRSMVDVLRGRHLEVARPLPPRAGEKPFWADRRSPDPMEMPVSSIMTSPAISAEEDTPVTDLCHIMWSLRIHRVPILKKGKVTGLVSSMDLCRAVLERKIRL